MPGTARVLERRDTVAIGEVDARTGLDEEPDDLPVCGASVAEDDRLEQCRPAEVVDVVDVDLGLQQRSDEPDVTPVCSRNQRRPAKAVRECEVGVCTEHLSQDVHVSGLARREKRVCAGVVLQVDVRPCVDEGTNDVRRAHVRGRRHRGTSALAPIVGCGAAFEQPLHLLQIPAARRTEELTGGRGVVVAPTSAKGESDQQRQQSSSYSTVTVFARFRGWSTLRPRSRAIR